jgi:hypothetical protein
MPSGDGKKLEKTQAIERTDSEDSNPVLMISSRVVILSTHLSGFAVSGFTVSALWRASVLNITLMLKKREAVTVGPMGFSWRGKPGLPLPLWPEMELLPIPGLDVISPADSGGENDCDWSLRLRALLGLEMRR